ncbi:hypothetical protein K435DRAFT_841352 [Dendrothele bispora CBS 962.96]|uniref:C3H1-type domain-containing protein n=1 Tax=Dendrothele bispora (strain CBS 962.96) TaxID=1314807 RepID=A0A4S8LP35_DENBC|nr:hypothetical protein K435DRAFT_841352 [Dendrothele bispora CBS 962.96]
MSFKNAHGVPYKKYQCRYFDERGQSLRTPCNQGDKCRFVHPTDPNWPGIKCHPFTPGYSQYGRRNTSNYSKNDRASQDRSQRSRSPRTRTVASLASQGDLFRRCKIEDDDSVLPYHEEPHSARQASSRLTTNSAGCRDGQDTSLQRNDAGRLSTSREASVERFHSQRKESSKDNLKSASKDPREMKSSASSSRNEQSSDGMKQTNDKIDTENVTLSKQGPSNDQRPSGPSVRSQQMVDMFRKITTVSSQIVQDTLTFNQEERKLETYNDISVTLARISESAASAVGPPLAEVILSHAQSKERLEEGIRTLGDSWDKVFDMFVAEVTQTINTRLEMALQTMRVEAKGLTDELVSERKATLKRKSLDYSSSDEGTNRPKSRVHKDHSLSPRDAKRHKTSGSFSSDERKDGVHDLSSLDEILLQMKMKIDQQNNSLQMLARENEELKGQLQSHGSRTENLNSPIPRGPKERYEDTQATPGSRHAPNESDTTVRTGARPRSSYSRDDESDRRAFGLSYRDPRGRDFVKRGD